MDRECCGPGEDLGCLSRRLIVFTCSREEGCWEYVAFPCFRAHRCVVEIYWVFSQRRSIRKCHRRKFDLVVLVLSVGGNCRKHVNDMFMFHCR